MLFTPDVEEALCWFEQVYQLQTVSGSIVWQLVHPPVEGGLADQPAKLMEMLALIAREENRLLRKARPQIVNHHE